MNSNQGNARLVLKRDSANSQPFVLQQLALATYKSKHPDLLSALLRAREVLKLLNPGRTQAIG